MQPLSLKPILQEAWQKVHDAKAAFFVLFIALGIVEMLLAALQSLVEISYPDVSWLNYAMALVFVFCCAPFIAGFYMLGIKRARGETLQIKEGFAYFYKTPALFLTQLLIWASMWFVFFVLALMTFFFGLIAALLVEHMHFSHSLLLSLGIVSAVLGAIVLITLLLSLTTLFCFAMALVIDQNHTPWQAYKTSLKMVFPHFKVLLSAQFIFALLYIAGAILVGIGLLWVIPFSYIATGIFYREISTLA